MIYDNDFNFTNQLLDVTDESFSQELETIKKEREALIQASHDLLGSDSACHYNSNPSPELNSFVDVASDVQKNDEDDLVIEQLTAQLHQLQQLLIQQQQEQAAQAADTTKKIINGLSVLLNRFINNFQDLHARMQAIVKKLSTKYYNLKNTLDFVSIDEIESVNQELSEFKASHHHEFVDQLQGLGEELVLALDYLKPDAVDALQELVNRTDVNVTGLVPHNLALKLFVKQAILKIKRLFSQADDLIGQTKNLWEKKSTLVKKEAEVNFKPLQTPFHDEVTSKCSESNSQFSHNKGASFVDLENGHDGEVTAQNQLPNPDCKESLSSLTDEITKLKSLMREEVEELQRINEEKEKKWKTILANETAKYEKEIAGLKATFETAWVQKQKQLHHLINDKIEAKANEIIDKDDQKLTRDDLRNVYKEIVDGEQLNFVNQLKAEQDNLKRQLDIERTRFEDIIELKSKEWAQEKDQLLKNKNNRLIELENKMKTVVSERDKLLEEKNNLLIDLQNLTVKSLNAEPAVLKNQAEIVQKNVSEIIPFFADKHPEAKLTQTDLQKFSQTKKIVDSLNVLLNRFVANFHDLSLHLQNKVKGFSTKYHHLKNSLDLVAIDEIENFRNELSEIKLTGHREFVEQVQSPGEELVLALDHLKPDAAEALAELVSRVDVKVTGLVPNNLALKLFINQANSKISRLFAEVDNLSEQTKNLLDKKKIGITKQIPLDFKPIVNPFKINGTVNSGHPYSSNPLLPVNCTQKQKAPDIMEPYGANKPEITNINHLLDNTHNQEIKKLTDEIEKLKVSMRQEISDLQRINEDKERKWKKILDDEASKYEKEIANLKSTFETAWVQKQKQLHHLINDKIEAKTTEILENNDEKLTRKDLHNAYQDIVNGEQLNFISQLKAEQDNLKRQLDIERTRFEEIIQLKSKEWAAEKDELLKNKNQRLTELEAKMKTIVSERDSLLQEKNNLLVDSKDDFSPRTPTSSDNPFEIPVAFQSNINSTNHQPELEKCSQDDGSKEVESVVDNKTPQSFDEVFNRNYFEKLNALRASKIDQEIAKAEAAQKKAQDLYAKFEDRRSSLQEQLKQAHERNSIEKLTREITERISAKFDNELQKLKSQVEYPTIVNSQYQYYQDPNLINFNELNNYPPYGYPQIIEPIEYPFEQNGANFQQPPYGYDQVFNHDQINENPMYVDEQNNQMQETFKPHSRKAVFLKVSDDEGRLSSEKIRKYANSIIAANRRKHTDVNL